MKHRSLIQAMTLEEKASLMSGKDFWETQNIDRLGIRSLFLADGPHGIRRQAVSADQPGLNEGIPATCFPPAATVANSWNPDLGEKVGQYLGTEAVAQGVNVLLGPGINMKRSPLCGRNFEYFSEDPFLAGKMAAAYVRGIQSQGVAACVKHFAAKSQETRAMAIDAVIDERTLREIYLTAFEIAVKEGGAKALMSSYNKVNGEYTTEHSHLMGDILRGEWGYQGVVVTDWGGSHDRVAGLRAGNELEMPTTRGETNQQIVDAVRSGGLDEGILDEAVDRLLDLIAATSPPKGALASSFDVVKHHRVTQRVAEESIVLLKNEGPLLPLKFGRKVAVVGEFARKARYQGAGSSIVNPTILDHTLECFEESGITSIGFERGFERYGRRNSSLIKKACRLAVRADVILLYLGLDELTEAQGLDRTTLGLPTNQVELLEALADVNPNIVVVLSCGSVVEMPWIGRVKGLIHAYLGGQAGARAILRVVSGDVNPSGKLAETYPLHYRDTPCVHHFPGLETSVEYREGPFIGYRYYDTAQVPVLFPFGYGLSYTTFEYSNLRVSRSEVTFELKNTGDVAGMEVAQVYVGRPGSAVIRPRKELKGFAKVFINAGETKTVTIPWDDKAFRYFDTSSNRWDVEAGPYQIAVGSSSADIRVTQNLDLTGTKPVPNVGPEQLPSYYSGHVQQVSEQEFEALLGRSVPATRWNRESPLGPDDSVSQCQYSQGLAGRAVYGILVLSIKVLRTLRRRRAANFLVMSVYHMPFRGISRMTGGLVTMAMVDGLLTMVNGHGFRGLFQFLGAWMHKNNKKREISS